MSRTYPLYIDPVSEIIYSNGKPDWGASIPWADMPEAINRGLSPYPEFCRHPNKCAGLGCCPRDPTCAD